MATTRPAKRAVVQRPRACTSAEEAATWHGYSLKDRFEELPLPQCVCNSQELSRPECTRMTCAEYLDHDSVLEIKVDAFINMLRRAQHPMIYAGAGISTSSGVYDYASNGRGSVVQAAKTSLTYPFINALSPTPAHRVLAALEHEGLFEHWLQQNHDGLAHKAGFPSAKINEIHGSWIDRKRNPVIKMSGSLRSDLFHWVLEWEERADFVFGIGTSFSGLNADRVPRACGTRHKESGAGEGLVILAIQQTQMDDMAALRIFCKCDDFMMRVARRMNLTIDRHVHPYVSYLDTAEGIARAAKFAKKKQEADE